jgi:UDP-N-acetylmuramyl pentapeptide phosphotransferase/UDP-N-acetylglucosamine-1-phosphate transferase
MTPSRADRIHAGFMLLAALGTLAYWLTYFSSGATQVRSDEVYLAFENAFPLADGWMLVSYLLSAYFLWRGDRRAVLWGVCAGSAMIFLGCMDLLFNLQQDHFQLTMSAQMTAEIVIVVFCLGFGPFTIWRLWRHPLNTARTLSTR